MGDVRRLVLSHALAACAMAMPWPVLLALTWEQTHSHTALSIVGALRMAPYVAVSWAAGALADRVSRTRLVLASATARAGLLVGTAAAVLTGPLGTAVAGATLVVAAGTPAYPAIAASIPGLAGSRDETTTGWLVTAEVSAFVVGPAIGGLILAIAGGDVALVASVLVAVAAAGLMSGLRLDVGRRAESSPGPSPEYAVRTRDQLRLVLSSSAAVRVIVAVAVINVVDGAVFVALLPMAESAWGDEHVYGLVAAALGFGALATPMLRRVLRLPATALRASLLLVVLPLALTAGSPTWVWAVLPLALLGAASTEVECVATTILQRSVPHRARAFALGLTDTVMVTGALVGAAMAPLATEALGPRPAFVGLGAMTALLLLIARIQVPERTTEPAASPDPSLAPQFT
jgi:MFS family permease